MPIPPTKATTITPQRCSGAPRARVGNTSRPRSTGHAIAINVDRTPFFNWRENTNLDLNLPAVVESSSSSE